MILTNCGLGLAGKSCIDYRSAQLTSDHLFHCARRKRFIRRDTGTTSDSVAFRATKIDCNSLPLPSAMLVYLHNRTVWQRVVLNSGNVAVYLSRMYGDCSHYLSLSHSCCSPKVTHNLRDAFSHNGQQIFFAILSMQSTMTFKASCLLCISLLS
jgi:hypothetical protein